jgi:hypothetical protein
MVLYLHMKGWRAWDISDCLVATLGEGVIAYSTVTKYLCEAWINPADATSVLDAASHHLDESNEAVLEALEKPPFSSFRQLARITHLSSTMVYRRLSEKRGMAARHLR